MSRVLSRRGFIAGLPALVGLGASLGVDAATAPGEAMEPGFPRMDPAVVKTFVGVAHRDVAEVRRMVERQPSLARAAWDWGFGDWETGLGAAAHTGRREIAEIVLAHGAHPTLFSAAMLGQLDVVKAMVHASPGIQRTPGPHGLTLMHHARAGGKDAEIVAVYLETLGDADTSPATKPIDPADRDAVVGRYVFGVGESDRLDVDVKDDKLGIQRPGMTRSQLWHTGELVFFPSGVPSVRIAFAKSGTRVTRLTVADPDVFVTANREG